MSELKPEDLRITTYRGDSKNEGVHIVHAPTGIDVYETKHRSQHRNKRDALEELTILVNQKTNA